MKFMDAPLSHFNITMVLLMFNISFCLFYPYDSSVVCLLYLFIHDTTISPTISVMSSFKTSHGSAHTLCIGSLILVALPIGVASVSFMET